MDLDLSGSRRDDPLPGYARRLGPVRRLCAVWLGAALLLGIASWILASRAGGGIAGLPAAVPLTLSLLAAVLILLASRLRSTLLRRALPRSAALAADAETVLAAYRRATLLGFAILEVAALLGLLVALISGSPVYGLVLCGASAFGMLSCWPRAVEVDRLIRGRAKP